MEAHKSQKIPKIFECKCCNYNTSNKKDYNKDLFNMAEVILLKHLIHELRVTEGLSLAQISRRLDLMMGRAA